MLNKIFVNKICIASIAILCISVLSCTNPTASKKERIPPISVKIFHEAAYNGNIAGVTAALKSGVQADTIDENGQNALMLAAFNGHTEIVKLLVQQGISVNAKDKTGRTALMFASTGAFPETVQFLIKKNAGINAIDNGEHFSPLMFAASEGQLEVVKILMSNGADASLKDIDGDTAESFAHQNEHLQVVEYLININK